MVYLWVPACFWSQWDLGVRPARPGPPPPTPGSWACSRDRQRGGRAWGVCFQDVGPRAGVLGACGCVRALWWDLVTRLSEGHCLSSGPCPSPTCHRRWSPQQTPVSPSPLPHQKCHPHPESVLSWGRGSWSSVRLIGGTVASVAPPVPFGHGDAVGWPQGGAWSLWGQVQGAQDTPSLRRCLFPTDPGV